MLRAISTAIATLFVTVCFVQAQEYPMRARAVYGPKPAYPLEARIHHWTGKGLLVIDVDQRTGFVTAARMVKSTGHLILDNAAITAFSRWRFEPGKVKKVKVLINFSMP